MSKGKAKPKACLRHPVPSHIIWISASCLVATLAVLGLHLWHPPIPVRLEVKAKTLTLAMPLSSETQYLAKGGLRFNGLSLSGMQSLEFIPANTQHYTAEQFPQADVLLESKGSLAGLDVPPGSSMVISSTTANTLQLRVSQPIRLHIPTDSPKPRLQVHNAKMGASIIEQMDIPLNPSSKLSITPWQNARLALALPDQGQLNLLDGPPLTVTSLTSQLQDYDSGAPYSDILSGRIDYRDDTELKAEELHPKAVLLIKGDLCIDELELDTKQGVLSIHLQGRAERLNVDHKDKRPSALERIWKWPLLAKLIAVCVFVVPVLFKAYDRYKESKSA